MVEPIANTLSESIVVNPSIPRQTPKPAASFAEAVKKGSSALLDAVSSAAGILPGGGIVAAAARMGRGLDAAGSLAGAVSETAAGEDPKSPGLGADPGPGTGLSDIWQLQKEGQLMNLEFLKVQESISRENRVFSTISNVLKARHETTRNAINNIR
jgi:hypothetical protein